MTPERYAQIRQVFESLLARPVEERTAALDQAAGEDRELQYAVGQLLQAHEHTLELLDRPAGARLGELPPDWPPAALTGTTVGPYTICREIGRGGMGAVYLAERQIGRVRQQVAVKVVRTESDDRAHLGRRFEQEREILASFDHANIARFLDVGTTPEGLPYLVMEYVQGEPITAWCDRHALSLAERLRLFRTVCAAVEYAHQRGVIHRDLKPSNILVTAEGVVKLLDFGIAKVTGDDLRDDTLTVTGMCPMTIEYASPEQLRGDAVTTATDVYSLGVVLYELLTGHRPYRLGRRLAHEAIRVICEEPPVPPSAIVLETEEIVKADGSTETVSPRDVARRRAGRPEWLQKELKGDLDSILAKILRKEASWRYASPAHLSEDLERQLTGRPVSAHQDSWRYRMGKLVRRALNPSGGQLHTSTELFLGWGVFGAVILGEKQAVVSGWKSESTSPPPFLWMILLNAVFASLREGMRLARAAQLTAMDRQAFIVFGVTVGTLVVLTAIAPQRGAIDAAALAMFWNAGLGMALLTLGLQAERVLTFGGAALLLSVVAAALQPGWLYASLAAGMVLGYIVPGLAFAVRRWGAVMVGIALAVLVAVPAVIEWATRHDAQVVWSYRNWAWRVDRSQARRREMERERPLIKVLYGESASSGNNPRKEAGTVRIRLRNFGGAADQVTFLYQGAAIIPTQVIGSASLRSVEADQEFTLQVDTGGTSRLSGALSYTSRTLQKNFTDQICLERSSIPLVDPKTQQTRDRYVACKAD